MKHIKPAADAAAAWQRLRQVLPGPLALLSMIGLVVAAMVLGVVTFALVRRLVADGPVDVGAGPDLLAEGGSEAGSQAPGTADLTQGRVTVLLMGIDERKVESGPWRTDTMILLTLDPARGTAGMLSIPRDLWVEIPNYGAYERINAAHFLGDLDQYPGGGGPALAMETVQYNLGAPVDYFASINFATFVQLIDQIGCIPIDVPQTIDDPNYPDGAYGYDPFYLAAGQHCLDGETLLKYARTRATPGSDFDRAARQQQVIYAVRRHVLSTGQLPDLIGRAPQLFDTAQAGINTNLSLAQMVELARLTASLDENDICAVVIDNDMTEPLTIPGQGDVLIPQRDEVRALVVGWLEGTGRCAQLPPEIAGPLRTEAARVSVLNGTPREGLAAEAGALLARQGVDVVGIGSAADRATRQTVIFDYTGKPATAAYIAGLLGLPEGSIQQQSVASPPYDIQIVLGEDYQPE